MLKAMPAHMIHFFFFPEREIHLPRRKLMAATASMVTASLPDQLKINANDNTASQAGRRCRGNSQWMRMAVAQAAAKSKVVICMEWSLSPDWQPVQPKIARSIRQLPPDTGAEERNTLPSTGIPGQASAGMNIPPANVTVAAIAAWNAWWTCSPPAYT
jgi:hypothetical protein